MPRIENWDEFAGQTKKMFVDDPIETRIVMKFRHKDNTLKVKTTNNKKAYQYIGQPKEVKNVDKLMSHVMRHMVN